MAKDANRFHQKWRVFLMTTGEISNPNPLQTILLNVLRGKLCPKVLLPDELATPDMDAGAALAPSAREKSQAMAMAATMKFRAR